MAYIVTNNSLVGEVADDDPALQDPSIEYGVQEIHLSGSFNFSEWFDSLPPGTIVARRSGYWEHALDDNGNFLEYKDPGYFEAIFHVYKHEILTKD